ncbi:MAG: efflux RND transporter permease subunit [Acidobacteria bacterium]|nr:efflux RND transporter permease subunit [Acidobacteriota bacterium]
MPNPNEPIIKPRSGLTARLVTETRRNTAKFFTETRQLSWVLMIVTLLWGAYAYNAMPKRKDPEVKVRKALAVCAWPGASAEEIEQQVTRKIEEKMSQNSRVETIESISRSNVSVVYLAVDEKVDDIGKELDDVRLKLDSIRDLPEGAGPIEFVKDFGDTSALMLTIASPKVNDVAIQAQAQAVGQAIARARSQNPSKATSGGNRATLIIGLPLSLNERQRQWARDELARQIKSEGLAQTPTPLDGQDFIGLDLPGEISDQAILTSARKFIEERLQATGYQVDIRQPVVIRDTSQLASGLRTVAGDRYSYRELDDFTDLVTRTLQTVPMVSKVTRSGVLKESVFIEYSQERLAGYGIQPSRLGELLRSRNITLPGGQLEVEGKNLGVDPSGEFKNEREISDLLVTTSPTGSPVYLRDMAEISRGYENPPRYLNFYYWRDAQGQWQRSRAITLAVQMRPGEQIASFGAAVDEALGGLMRNLPDDLILARTSDQPLQVEENIGLFTRSLIEAILLVVLVALIGFREWRSALLVAASIPLTLAMTFGMMHVLGVDLQQVSIASLILALGLLVDDPVVASDAIKREMAQGRPIAVAAWLGPSKLAEAILYATITNIVAYLPLLLVSGSTGAFIWSLPVVITCSLVASRIVSMTFIPFLAYYLLRPSKKREPTIAEMRQRGFSGVYYKVGAWALEHRWKTLAASLVFLLAGGLFLVQLRTEFFPKDLSYLSYLNVWLPEDAPLSATNEAVTRAEAVIREVTEAYGKEHSGKDGKPKEVLQSLTSFVGGGGPRFWFSAAPEHRQLNYAQIIIQLKDKRDTGKLVAPLQEALSAKVPGARIDFRQLETSRAIDAPVETRISGQDIGELRRLAEEVKEIYRAIPEADRVRDDWGAESFVANLRVEQDRANLAGISNLDVAASSAVGISGYEVTSLREGKRQIPVVVRLRAEERANLSDVQNLYVYALQSPAKASLRQISGIDYQLQSEKIRRRNQFRTITVSCFPVPGALPSQVYSAARARLDKFEQSLPPGYRMGVGGEREQRLKGFRDLAVVMAVSVIAIFLALVVQFKHAIKPLLVFSAIPFGMVGAFAALAIMGAPFGFIAFLGIASLIGVIVSHVIVLFDFVEEKREEGEPLREALLDAGIARLRPVMITIGATIFGLIPLAMNGGPLWEALCYAQIGGLLLANYVTKLLVPALYAIFVLDLKLIKWHGRETSAVSPLKTAPLTTKPLS